MAGHVTTAAAKATGLPTGVPVATGAGDVSALAVGCGIVAPGRVAITLSTAGHVVAQGTAATSTRNLGLWRIPHAVPGRTLFLGLIMSGGLSLSWLRGILSVGGGQPPDFAHLEALASGVPFGSRGITFVPFLDGAATPYRRPDAQDAFLGLCSSHGTGELVRAVMEGVAFNALDCIDALTAAGIPVNEFRLAEGGAQSLLWCGILAGTMGRPVRLIQ